MGDHAYIGELTAAIFYLAAGVHLLRVASRAGLLQERILGLAFLLFGISYLFYIAPDILPALVPLITPLSFLGRITTAAGMVGIAMFTWQVFRRDAAWAKWLAWGNAFMILVGIGVSIWEGDWSGFSTLTSVGYWLVWVGETIPLAWVGVEGFVCYTRAAKRVKLGLSAPLLANRFSLAPHREPASATAPGCHSGHPSGSLRASRSPHVVLHLDTPPARIFSQSRVQENPEALELPWAHTVFGNLKTWLRGTFHGVSPKHLQRYLDEFVFRFDRRWKEAELFPRVLHCAIDTKPFPCHRLTAERSG